MTRRRVRVWDLPTRLFHWLLVPAIAGAWLSGETGGNWLIWHGRLGLFVIGLVIFRVIWGFVGSTYARFATFLPTPGKLKAYLLGDWRGLGHNPLGALSVFGLLGLVTLQAASGLFAYNDDIAYGGHLYALATSTLSDQATHLHHQVADLLVALAGLHVAAIVFYVRIRKDDLLKPMLTGDKAADHGDPARGGSLVAFAMALALASASTWAASGAWIETLPPPPAATPAW